MHEEPVVALRDLDSGEVTVVTLGELLEMQRVAARLVADRLAGSQHAADTVQQIAALVRVPHAPNRGRAILSAYLIRDVLEALAAYQVQPQVQGVPADAGAPAAAPQPPAAQPAVVEALGECPHGVPTDVSCDRCPDKEV